MRPFARIADRSATSMPPRKKAFIGAPKSCAVRTSPTGTVMESSHVPLHKWRMGFYLMSSSKKGISAHQLHRTLGVTYKTAWFMAHRIREALRAGGLEPPLGGEGKQIVSLRVVIPAKAGIQ